MGFLYSLAQGWFVIPWYVIGALGAWFVIYDIRNMNTPLKPAMKWAWPIIVFFFSVVGLALYFLTARAPGIGKIIGDESKKEAHHSYENNMWRRVTGAVIHCVAGDGFGIMTGMVIARAASMSFWQEFWFEYIVGFAIGWFIFQRKSMEMLTDNLALQLAMSFRAEFFSMLTVMGGMGAVMTFVTPLVATSQPKPLTYAFWGFGMLGLLAGFILTYPMNWMMVKIGWKHGMGGMERAEKKQIKSMPMKAAVLTTMSLLGIAALLLPAWLTNVRAHVPIHQEQSAIIASQTSPAQALYTGLNSELDRAQAGLKEGNKTEASTAIDDALRAAEVGAHSAPGSFYSSLEQIRDARIAYQQGHESDTLEHLANAAKTLTPPTDATPRLLDVTRYRGATLVDQEGRIIGKVEGTSADELDLAVGGWNRAWGFIGFGAGHRVTVPVDHVAFGPPQSVGMKLVMLPAEAQTTARSEPSGH